MKNLLLKFADHVLSRDELKNVKGGDGPYATQCNDGVAYPTKQQCELKCKGANYSNCSSNPSNDLVYCACY